MLVETQFGVLEVVIVVFALALGFDGIDSGLPGSSADGM